MKHRAATGTWAFAWGRALVLLSIGWIVLAADAWASSADQSATRLADRAMNQEFAGADFPTAKKTLQGAIASCKKSCSPQVQARLHRDLAVVLITGFNDVAAGERELEQALTADPALQLDPVFASPEVTAAFQRVKGRQPSAAVEKPKVSASTEGGVRHDPVTEQQVGVPIPIYAELTEPPSGNVKGRLHYRDEDAEEWQVIPVHKVGDGYGAEIPCGAVRKLTTLEYYVEFQDEDGEPIGAAGSKKKPFDIELVREEPDEPPHFPDKDPPDKCTKENAPCQSNADCEAGVCEAGSCVEQPARPRGPRRYWFGIGVAQDLMFVSGSDVCTEQSQVHDGFSCFRSNGSQYHGTPVRGRGDSVGGIDLATTRALVTLDAVVAEPFTLGVRVGYTLRGGGPRPDGGSSYLPWLAEVHAAYWFPRAFGPSFSPYVTLAGGLAQVDAKNSVKVLEDRSVPPPPNQLDNPDTQTLDAWKKSGLSFVAIGGGAYVPVTEHSGVTLEARFLFLFPDSGVAPELAVGYAFGP